MTAFLQDLRYAARQLVKTPGFTIAAVLTLAIGIGANTAIFSNMDAVVLRPLAVPQMDRVVIVAEEQSRAGADRVALANYADWLRQSRSFEELSVRSDSGMSLTGAGDAAHVTVARTSGNFFSVLRAQALFGRVFSDAECTTGRDAVAVLNYSFWQQHFGADPGIVGHSVQLDQRDYTIIGVMPKTLQYPSTTDVFVPLAATPQQLADRKARQYYVLGRLQAGATVSQAQAEMRGIAQRMAAAYPADDQGWSAKVEPLLDDINGPLTPLYYKLIMGATLFVLLVVCVNVANLQFARGIARQSEIAMRTALGASRSRILRQLLTENVLLACVGAAAGIAFAAAALHAMMATMPPRVARYISGWSNTKLDLHALGFSLLIAIGAGIVAGIAPALQALRLNVVNQLKSGSRSTTGSAGGRRLRSVFAVSQLALAVMLVIGATLMWKGMQSQLTLGHEYEPQKKLTFQVSLPEKRFDTPQKQSAWFAETLQKLSAIPGVAHAEVTSALPYTDDAWVQDFAIEHRPVTPGKMQAAERLTVSPGYFSQFQIAITAGRGFAQGDAVGSLPVAIVSRKFADRYFAGENPLGRRIRMGDQNGTEPWVTIVGVAQEVQYTMWDTSAPPAEVYLDAMQMPANSATYVMTIGGDPHALAAPVRKAIAAVDATIPLDGVMTYQESLHERLIGLRHATVMLGIDALIALLLAAVGVFGVMANMVGERTREIGLRLAMGARREDVLRMVLGRAVRLMGVGLGCGLVLAFLLARLVANLLRGVQPDDPLVFSSITVATALIALAASWIPARRAARVEPMVALRDE